jgi:diacylglycerol kinase (ATP)
MAHQDVRGFKRIINAFRYTSNGFRKCFKYEEAFRQEVFTGLVVIPLGIWLGDTGVERALLAGSWMVVIIVELLNSAVETTVDRVGREQHELSGRAKDLGSAAVFTSIVFNLVVWCLILIPRWLS